MDPAEVSNSTLSRVPVIEPMSVLFGAWDTTSGLPVALTAPEAIWEFSLNVWLLVEASGPAPILTGPPVVPSKTS